MCKAEKAEQMTFEDINQSCGMKLDVRDEWIVAAGRVDWAEVEVKYMAFFPKKRGRPALNARMALGALIIQQRMKLSDRRLVRGKAKTPVEFGAKYDVSVDEKAHARLEKMSFDAYNECTVFKDVLERYRERTGHYPRRVLVDQVYRTKDNREYCEQRGVKMSGRGPGRPPADAKERRRAERMERKDDVDRIEVERFFSRDKRCFCAGLIMTKLSKATLGSIALSVLVANLFDAGLSFFVFYFAEAVDGTPSVHLMEALDDAA